MQQKTLGERIAELRKKQGMTQLALAEKMCVTDKAVSKWERNLSCPDVGSLPRLAEILEVSTEELIKGTLEKDSQGKKMFGLALRAVALAMGAAVASLTAIGAADTKSAAGMLGIGLACLALYMLREK